MKLRKFIISAIMAASVIPAAMADADFISHRYDSFKAGKLTDKTIAFVGNSITNMGCWYEQFDNSPNVVNRGNSGACSYEALANLETLLIDSPAQIYVMIGTNDIGTQTGTPETIARNGRAFIERVKHVSPTTKVHIVSTFPSTNGYRNLQNHAEINRLLKLVCEETETTFIDLWDQMQGIVNGSISIDRLHITAPGYYIWSAAVQPYMGSEYTVTIPATTESPVTSLNKHNGDGMRPNMLASLPMTSRDILMIGGEMICGGEWHELLQNTDVKGRGVTFSYGDFTIPQWRTVVGMMFDQNKSIKEEPAQILLYTGTQELCNGNGDVTAIANDFKSLVELIKTKAPNTSLKILSQLPATNTGKNDRVKQYNALLQTIATETGTEYIDIFTPMANADGTPNQRYITTELNGPYVRGRGYIRLAHTLAPVIGNCTPIQTEEEFDARYELINARNALGSIADRYYTTNIGTVTGTFSETCLPALAEIRDRAYAALAERTMSAAEMNALAAELETRYSEVPFEMNNPIDGKYYEFIAKRGGQRMYMENENSLKSSEPANVPASYTTAQWQLLKRADGDWNIVNRKYGLYISPNARNNTALPVSDTEPSAGWRLTPIGMTGNYIVTSGTTQLNATGSGQQFKIYNWGYSEGTFNTTDVGCIFTINQFADNAAAVDPTKIFTTPRGSTDTEVIWYTFQTPARDNKYTSDSDNGLVSGQDNAASDYARWKLVEREGESEVYDIINKKTAAYLNPASIVANDQYKTTSTRPESGWSFLASATAGQYIIVSGTKQLHQANAGMNYRVINWGYTESSGQFTTNDAGCKFRLDGLMEEVPPTPVTTISLDKTEISIKEGDIETITATLAGADKDAAVTWSSSDETVATVSTQGKVNYIEEDAVSSVIQADVTAIATGTATITAACGDVTATCQVTVTANEEGGITGIESRQTGADTIYDLQGRKIGKASRGLYIVNGVKSIIR